MIRLMPHAAVVVAVLLAGCSETKAPSPPGGPHSNAAVPARAPDVAAWPSDLAISLTLTREYGYSTFRACRLELLVFDFGSSFVPRTFTPAGIWGKT